MEIVPDAVDHATRRVAASFYYDQSSTHRLLDFVGQEDHRFIAQHDGLDARTIVAHAATSLTMWRRHNWVMLGVAVIPTLWAAIAIQSGWVLVIGAVLLALNLWIFGIGGRFTERSGGPTQWLIIAGVSLAILYLAGAALTTGSAAGLSGIVALAFVFPFALAVLADLAQRIAVYTGKLEQFKVGAWDPTPPAVSDPDIKRAIHDLELFSTGNARNATVYSGYVPFVGSGLEIMRWNQALELRRCEEDDDPAERSPRSGWQPDVISEPEITAYLLSYLQDLDIPNTRMRRWHFVEGTQATDVPNMFGGSTRRPTGSVDPALVVEGKISHEVIRPYLWITSSRWSGDVVFNTFIRVAPHGTTLFLEIGHYVVPPIRHYYDRCDLEFSLSTWSTWSELIVESLGSAAQLLGNIRWDLTRTRRWQRSSGDLQKRRARGLAVDYGARRSIRDLYRARDLEYYFQDMDACEFRKTVNVHLLTALNSALKQRGFEISGFESVVQSLTNNVSISAGQIGNMAMAVGSGNRSTLGGSASDGGGPNPSGG